MSDTDFDFTSRPRDKETRREYYYEYVAVEFVEILGNVRYKVENSSETKGVSGLIYGNPICANLIEFLEKSKRYGQRDNVVSHFSCLLHMGQASMVFKH